MHKAFVAEQVKDLLEKGVIYPIESDQVSPLVIVPKKNGKLRMCVDFRRLNENMVKVRYPSPFIYDDIINCLDGRVAQLFATLDLISGYWQVGMDQDSQHYTAFTCFLGTFAFKVMQFGLCNAVAAFQKMMNIALALALGRICFVYLDDIIVYAKTNEELVANLREIFGLLQKAGLTLSPEKCEFFKSEVQILGQVVSNGVVKPQPAKLKILQDFREPRIVKECQQFLGLVNYFRNYIPAVAEMSYPIQKLCERNTTFEQTKHQQRSFDGLKEILKSGLFLYIPNKNALMVIQVTVTNIAYSAMLCEELNGLIKPL